MDKPTWHSVGYRQVPQGEQLPVTPELYLKDNFIDNRNKLHPVNELHV